MRLNLMVLTIRRGREGSLQPSRRLSRVTVAAHLNSNTSIGSLGKGAQNWGRGGVPKTRTTNTAPVKACPFA